MQDPVSPGKSVDPVLIFKKIHDQLNNHIPGVQKRHRGGIAGS